MEEENDFNEDDIIFENIEEWDGCVHYEEIAKLTPKLIEKAKKFTYHESIAVAEWGDRYIRIIDDNGTYKVEIPSWTEEISKEDIEWFKGYLARFEITLNRYCPNCPVSSGIFGRSEWLSVASDEGVIFEGPLMRSAHDSEFLIVKDHIDVGPNLILRFTKLFESMLSDEMEEVYNNSFCCDSEPSISEIPDWILDDDIIIESGDNLSQNNEFDTDTDYFFDFTTDIDSTIKGKHDEHSKS